MHIYTYANLFANTYVCADACNTCMYYVYTSDATNTHQIYVCLNAYEHDTADVNATNTSSFVLPMSKCLSTATIHSLNDLYLTSKLVHNHIS